MFYISLLLVIAGTVFYELLEKTVPKKVNSYLYLIFTYLFAIITLIIALIIMKYDINMFVKDFNIQSILVGIFAMFADYGLILAYRKGWKISTLNITYTISLLIMLMIIGSIFLNEIITGYKIIGTTFGLISIILLNTQNIKKRK